MTFMCVSLVEPLRQTMMGWIPVLEYMMSGACGRWDGQTGDKILHAYVYCNKEE
jgi:hypothetical protein